MTRVRVFLAALAIGAGAGVVWMMLPSATPGSASATNTGKSTLDDQRLDRLERDLARLESAGTTTRANSNQRPIVDTDDPPIAEERVRPTDEPALSHEQSVANEHAVVREVVVGLADALARETVDESWAPQTEAAIAEVLRDENFRNLALTRVECRRSLCRIDVAVADAEDEAEERIGKLTEMGPFRNGGFADFRDPDAVGMFIAREGHPLPPL